MNTKPLSWKPLRPKVSHKPLAKDDARNLQMDIIKLDPNTKYNPHSHPESEWVYILAGSMTDENGTYRKDDFLINEKDSVHSVTSGPEGCEILCVWCGEVKPIK